MVQLFMYPFLLLIRSWGWVLGLYFSWSVLLQVSLWSNNYLKAASGDPLPEMQRLMDWLPHHTPHSNLQSEAHTYTKDVVQIVL